MSKTLSPTLRDELEVLTSYLAYRPIWTPADVIRHDLGLNDRQLRRLAQASAGEIITSNEGYRSVHCSSDKNIRRCISRLASQVRANRERIRTLNAVLEARRKKTSTSNSNSTQLELFPLPA